VAMVMAMGVAVVLSPRGANAASMVSKVLITDPTNNAQQAHVDANGILHVGGTVIVGNTPNLQVGGTVSSQQSGAWNVALERHERGNRPLGQHSEARFHDPSRRH